MRLSRFEQLGKPLPNVQGFHLENGQLIHTALAAPDAAVQPGPVMAAQPLNDFLHGSMDFIEAD
jgi:hypothetical protein